MRFIAVIVDRRDRTRLRAIQPDTGRKGEETACHLPAPWHDSTPFRDRGHSLMVKLQPSKLAMRVRFSLPAPSLEINDLCRYRGVSGDFPNTFSLALPVCPILSILSPRSGNLVENAPRLAWRSNALNASGTEQIPAKARMADCAVADDIDESRLAGLQRAF
jgi:hypothetical protein